MKHNHILKDAPEKDKQYTISLKGEELFDAKVLEYEGGCWAKVKVEKVHPGKNENLYKEGQEFDLKLAYYKLFELSEPE